MRRSLSDGLCPAGAAARALCARARPTTGRRPREAVAVRLTPTHAQTDSLSGGLRVRRRVFMKTGVAGAKLTLARRARRAAWLSPLVVLAVPALSSAHPERPSYWPNPRPDQSISPPA